MNPSTLTPPPSGSLAPQRPGAGTPPPLSLTTPQASITTPPTTPPRSPVSALTPASTNPSVATNATAATNAPPGSAAATGKSKSSSVFSSIASSIFSTVSSIFTYLGEAGKKLKEKVKKFVGFFIQRGLTDEERAALRPTAKDEAEEIEKQAKAIEAYRAGEHLKQLQDIQQEAAFAKREVGLLQEKVNPHEKKASEERRQAFDAMRK